MKDKIERKLKKAKIDLLREPKFALWSGLLMVGKTVLDDDFPTACTDGRDEYYGRSFVSKLKEKELRFVILHENLHKMFRHLTTWRKLFEEDEMLAGMACDYVINLMLVRLDPDEAHIAMPQKDGKPWGLLDVRFDKMNAKQVFDILKKEKKGKGKKPGNQPGGQPNGGTPGFDEHDWKKAKGMSKKETEKLGKEIDRAIRQGQIAAKRIGAAAGEMDRVIGELLEPKVDWREVLREFVVSVCSAKDASSWRRVNRRMLADDVYLPSLIGERVEQLVLGGDTSGSMGPKELQDGMSEAKGIMDIVRPARVDMLYWDSSVEKHEVYEEGNMDAFEQETRPRGGGGTTPRCVQEYLKEKNIKPQCIVMFTDGYIADWGDAWEVPILWVIVGGNKVLAPVGKTVHVEQ